ncbi:MAG: KEOPS complex subunit Cgi121 [Candidatus Burarchaeum sp.]|nr:KEOPS complex subunit Cgi121 [Candidatus Burarchaeum sp.]MDO8340088.1 KEOPS complex subunit Cgi121 [Candidatus Burarchaeum sp.]
MGELIDALVELRRREKCFAQAFDPSAIISERQLLLAYENAKKAFDERRNIANCMDGEMMARAGGTRKIKEALARVGAKDTANVLICADCSKNEMLNALGEKELKPTFIGEKKEIAKRFGISAKMLKTYPLEQCVLEKVAMADVE